MVDKQYKTPFHEISTWKQLFKSVLIIITVGIVLTVLLLSLGSVFFNSTINRVNNPAISLGRNDIYFLKYMVMVQTFSFFVVPAIILLRKLKPPEQVGYPEFSKPSLKETGIIIVLAFCMFSITSVAGELNLMVHFPEWLAGFEKWIRAMEEDANQLMEKVMGEAGSGGLLINILMVAALPAIGEEMIFRGIFQKIFTRMTKSGHAGVWVTAILFSALHLQFLGFLPRLLLGLAFGYLYLWSGKLWLPILAHFINNLVPVIIAFFYGWEQAGAASDIKLWQEAILLPLPVYLIFIIMKYFRDKENAERLNIATIKTEIAESEISGSENN